MKLLIPYTITTARLSSSSVPENDHPEWLPVTYSAGDRVIRAATHQIYERASAGASAIAPELDEAGWIKVGPTNRWAMLDESVGSSTTANGSVSVTLALPGSVGDVVLMGVIGSSVAIAVNGSTVRTASVPAQAVPGAGSTLVISGLAIGGAPSLSVTVTGSGVVSVGTLAVGTFSTIGQPEVGMKLGMQDYSSKTFDAYGSATVVRRSSSRKIDVQFTAASTSFDQAARILAAARSRPAIWQGLPWLDATCVYGICADWSLSIHRGIARGSVSVRGLAFGS